MSIDLEEVVLDGGARFVNFFEGRILTGRDLRDEQAAARARRATLGRAIGWGVVQGLEVSDATPAQPGAVPQVRVAMGLAVSRGGQTLDLAAERLVRLAEIAANDPAHSAHLFGECVDQPVTSSAPTAEGFHLLTIGAASGYEQEAPKAGLGDGGIAKGCGRRYATMGLRFRTQRFDPALIASGAAGTEIATLALTGGDAALSRLRSLVSHLGLGTTARAGFGLDPFAQATGGGSAWAAWGLESLLTQGAGKVLSDCEVPLAILRLRAGRIDYVDMWGVRRSPRTAPAAGSWPLISSAARKGVDAATFHQFQEQLAWLVTRLANPAAAQAVDHFRYLPPVGFLPFAAPAPFLPNAAAPLPLDPGEVIPIVEAALAYPAVDLATQPTPGFTTYRVNGTTSWILFVSNIVPSEAAQAAVAAALAARVAALEGAVSAPGLISGIVGFTINGGMNPISGMEVIAIAADETRTSFTTGPDGRYTLSVPPGDYSLTLDWQGFEIVSQKLDGITVERGRTQTRDFTIPFTLFFR